MKILLLIIIAAVVIGAGFYIDGRMRRVNISLNTGTGQPETTSTNIKVDFKNYGPAPDFVGINKWLNSEPLTIKDLRGKIVLVDFWTYSCINCIRTLSYVTKWYDTYKDKGFVVIGVHTPEFVFEKETGNVQDAIKRFGIHYPVAQDNDYGTWKAYNNQYWPAEYLIDKNGNVVRVHFGEGEYDVTENSIRSLLGMDVTQNNSSKESLGEVASPEMYFGTNRLQNLTPEQLASLLPKAYSLPKTLSLNNFALEGNWQFSKESIKLVSGQGKIKLKFHAGKIHFVASSQNSAKLKITVDGQSQPPIVVKNSELYSLFDSNDYSDHIIEIMIDNSGFEAFTFTFG